MKILIETERLILRPVTLDDTQDFFEMDSNPNVHKYLGNNPVKSIDQSKAWIEDILDQYETFGLGRLAVVNKTTNEFLGWSGIKYERQVRAEFNYYDLGYRFKEQHWGNGYATEAAIASLKFGFEDLKLDEICGAAEDDHFVSNLILKKIGLQPSGTFTYDGCLCNLYSLKRDQWIP